MSETRDFRVDVHYESDHMWAQVVNLPGCFASGRDADELSEALAEAIGLYLSEKPGDCKVLSFELDPPPSVNPVRAWVERLLRRREDARSVARTRARAELVPA